MEVVLEVEALLIILALPAPAHARQEINVGCGQEWSPVPAARNGLHAAMVRPWTTMDHHGAASMP